VTKMRSHFYIHISTATITSNQSLDSDPYVSRVHIIRCVYI